MIHANHHFIRIDYEGCVNPPALFNWLIPILCVGVAIVIIVIAVVVVKRTSLRQSPDDKLLKEDTH